MRTTLLLLIVVVSAGCGRIDALRHALLRTPPYDRYAASLREAGIDRTPIGAAWRDAGERALAAPRTITVPSRDTHRLRHDSPSAIAYRMELRRGQVYRLAVEPDRTFLANVYVDMFRVVGHEERVRVASAGPPARYVAFEPSEDDVLIVRIQPQLLGDGTLQVTHALRAALLFPVPGAGRRNVQSLFGAARSGGSREHQGIDIFAPRGTPVVAAADGWISSTSPNTLGGNVVWVWDPARDQTMYYAHLDRHAVSRGQRVRKGDVVGFVGNTGNARSTAPHLHFGIYRRGRGAIDPLYYVVDPPS